MFFIDKINITNFTDGKLFATKRSLLVPDKIIHILRIDQKNVPIE